MKKKYIIKKGKKGDENKKKNRAMIETKVKEVFLFKMGYFSSSEKIELFPQI